MLPRVFRLLGSACCALAALWVALPALADNWQAPLYESDSPRQLVGVDKKRHLFNFFEKQSPFKLRYSYRCVTGQLPGDKQQINDMRTPEGIYFVEYKIASGLDFREYGGIAYTLNYPNPVDRLRGKTGYGIWIHSKGFGLTPTRGCVAINLDNIAEVGPHLKPGTPVVVAEELQKIEKTDNGTLSELRTLMADWSNAWSERSHRLFDFYDPDAYSLATENFDLFRKNKERLFKILSFIKIYNREINALEGPGYWVTWAEQLYTASNLSTEGVRRLYWQKDKNNKFRIVGMEWTPRDLGMATAHKQGTLVAEGPRPIATDAASEAPMAPRLDMPEQGEAASQAEKAEPASVAEGAETASESPAHSPSGRFPATIAALAENLENLAEPFLSQEKPVKRDEFLWGQGKPLKDAKQKAATPEIKAPLIPVQPRPTPALELPVAPKTATSDKNVLTDAIRTEIDGLAQTWREHLQDRNVAIEKMYDAKAYNRLPASLGIPRGPSLSSSLQAIRRDFRQPWLTILSRSPRISGTALAPKSEMDMMLVTPQGIRQGVQTLWWHKDAQGDYRIVASDFKNKNAGLDAAYLEHISTPIAAMIEDWRKAWQAGNVDEYISFYAANAQQQGIAGAANIRRQKQNLWSRVRPQEVDLSGIRIHLNGSGARADMTQAYLNSAGHRDKGVKTLDLQFDGEKWRIRREVWTAVQDGQP